MSNFFSNNNQSDNIFSSKSDITEDEDLFAIPQDDESEEMQSAQNVRQEDNSLNGQYNNLKLNYKEIFIEAAESIRRDLDNFKPENGCDGCSVKDCQIGKKDIFAPYPPSGCKYREWQMQAITYLAGDYKLKLKAAYKDIMDKKNDYECNKCGECCKLAVSPFSYEQLKQKAMRGDKYSEAFISVFVPYKTEEEAKTVNPEYFELLNELVEDDKIYYYYCPKLGEDNLCTIYDDRPSVCRDFPYNPLKLLPSKCSFNEWKNAVAHKSMLLKAKTDIVNYYNDKLG